MKVPILFCYQISLVRLAKLPSNNLCAEVSKVESLHYSGDLNSELVPYSDHGHLFARQMVQYSDVG